MGKINVLDASVANMIAAGEVVERPSSVVKELVENSIDAGASAITVEIKNGGISYIRVTDNGRGIEQDDVGLAFVRHATSKILEAKDLEMINTLGFRGEALCSIAAVSHVVLTSKTADAQTATRVIIEGGEMDNVDEVGAPNGTTIEVKKLFYNTPARMKFLKKDTTEAGYITDIMQRFVLAHPEISFRYINSGKQVFHSSGDGELINAIYTVYGRDYANAVIPIYYGNENLSVSGYVGKSTIGRPNRIYQSFYVNNRYIKSKSITVALDEAYKNQLMGGKFPFAVIKLTINPSFVDVNVHPNKMEVKFSDEKTIFDTVYWGVKNALYEKKIIPDVSIKEKREAYKSKEFAKEEKEFVQTFFNIDVPKKAPTQSTVLNTFDLRIENETDIKPVENNVQDNFKLNEQSDTKYTLSSATSEHKEEKAAEEVIKEEQVAKEMLQHFDSPAQNDVKETENLMISEQKMPENYKIIGAVFDTYIIIEYDDKLLLIDQHAAHERLKFEQLKRQMKNESIQIQALMSSVVVDLSAIEFAYVCENKERFIKLGFDIEEFGDNTIIINGAPADTEYNDAKDLFIELLAQMMSDKKQIIAAHDERAMYTIACKAAIKANKPLNEREMRSLVDEVLALDAINTCPHGRPITVSLTRYELEKQFKRII